MTVAERHVVVVGPMGVGKSTVGSALADRTGRGFSDSDREIERWLGVTGRAFAARSGVDALHRLEASVAMDALLQPEPLVIAVAASVVENHTVQWLLSADALVVRLLASPDVLVRRGSRGRHRRPMSPTEILALAERREPYFRLVQDVSFDIEAGTDRIVEAVHRSLGRAGSDAHARQHPVVHPGGELPAAEVEGRPVTECG